MAIIIAKILTKQHPMGGNWEDCSKGMQEGCLKKAWEIVDGIT